MDVVLDVSVMTTADPAVAPAGWRVINGSSTALVVRNGVGLLSTGNVFGGWEYASPLIPSSNIITVSCSYKQYVNSDGRIAATLLGSSGGYRLRVETFNIFIERIDGDLSGTVTVLSNFDVERFVNDEYTLTYNVSTGLLTAKINGTSVLTTTDTTYTAASFYGGAASRGFERAAVSEITVFNVAAAASITSINNGNPVTVGQTGVVITHTGFAGAVTSVTTNRSGVTCAITAGDASSTTVTVSGWVEGGAYPVVDNTVTFTCTRGAESASATQTLTKPANYAQVTFSGAITDDPNLIGYHLAANGHTVNGGTFYYRTNQVSTLTVNVDTSWTSAPAGGTFSATFIPVDGPTAGNAYLFDITVVNGSIAPVVTPVGARERSILRVSGSSITIDGTAHTNGQPISLSPYGGVQSGINGTWIAQSASASAGSLVLDGVTIAPRTPLYVSPAGKLTTTPNGRPVAVVRP